MALIERDCYTMPVVKTLPSMPHQSTNIASWRPLQTVSGIVGHLRSF